MAGQKKKHFKEQAKEKAVGFYRTRSQPLRTAALVLEVPFSTLSAWERAFDEQMRPYKTTDNRGRAAKVTVEIIRLVVEAARAFKATGRRLRIKDFSLMFNREHQMELSSKTVQAILTANDLHKPETKQKRPKFYKNLCQQIPNGLVSLDGSNFVLRINGQTLKYNIELGVDVDTFCHTGFDVSRTETAEAVIKVLEQHRQEFGLPLGVVVDSGSWNLSEQVRDYLRNHEIQIVPAGPANPKGNGSDESAFSLLKKTIGDVELDASSPWTLGKSILDAILSVYVKMRNQLALRKPRSTPLENMQTPVTEEQYQYERQKLTEHVQNKYQDDANQPKLDRLYWVVNHYGLTPEPAELQRAEKCIKAYDMEAISKTEKAFLPAVNRNQARRNLSYFFGILKNIQQEIDDQRYQDYCREHYNYELQLEYQRRRQEHQAQNQRQKTMEQIVDLATTAIGLTSDFLKESALKKCRKWLEQLCSQKSYVQPVRKKIQDAIGNKKDLDLDQKEQVSQLMDQLITQTVGA